MQVWIIVIDSWLIVMSLFACKIAYCGARKGRVDYDDGARGRHETLQRYSMERQAESIKAVLA